MIIEYVLRPQNVRLNGSKTEGLVPDKQIIFSQMILGEEDSNSQPQVVMCRGKCNQIGKP